MKLKQYIEQQHNGNQAALAREFNTNEKQVGRWLKMDCMVINGEIWRRVQKHKGNAPATCAALK